MAEKLSIEQIKDLSDQVTEESSKWLGMLDPKPGFYVKSPESITPEMREAALDAMVMHAFRQGLDVVLGKMLPILHLPSGKVVQFQIKEEE